MVLLDDPALPGILAPLVSSAATAPPAASFEPLGSCFLFFFCCKTVVMTTDVVFIDTFNRLLCQKASLVTVTKDACCVSTDVDGVIASEAFGTS